MYDTEATSFVVVPFAQEMDIEPEDMDTVAPHEWAYAVVNIVTDVTIGVLRCDFNGVFSTLDPRNMVWHPVDYSLTSFQDVVDRLITDNPF